MDESPDHEPTLIERGMGVHLNHPLAAQREIRNSRPDRWGLWKPHPPSRGGTTRARLEQDEELAPIASNGPRFRGSTYGYTSWAHRMQDLPVTRVRPRPARISPMPVETNATHIGKKLAKKPLQERSRSCRASGARPAGPLTRSHGKAFATRREEHPISGLQNLRDPNGNPHRCSGATVGDSPKGPLNNRGETRLKPAKNANANRLTHLTRAHSTTTILVALAARQDNTTDAPRVKSASLEG
jgi:hypothetical protein